MRVLLALILAFSVVACGAALIDFALFLDHPPPGPSVSLWTCIRIHGGPQIGCLSD